MVDDLVPLRRAFHFSRWNLVRNRSGQLSLRQRLPLRRELLIAVIVVVALAAIVLYYVFHLDEALKCPTPQ